MYQQIDDCNLGFIDFTALKRFLNKCGTVVTNEVLIAIIRRLDLDADARLSIKEFFEGIVPQEAYTKKTSQMQSKPKRAKSAKMPFVLITNTMFQPQPINTKLKREKSPKSVQMKPPKVDTKDFAKRIGEIIKLEKLLQVERDRCPQCSPEQVYQLFA